MKKDSRLLVYILLNIIISAATVLVVLWIWDLTHPTPSLDQNAAFLPNPEDSPSQFEKPVAGEGFEISAPTLAFVTDEIQVSIHAIVGAGNLEVEYVEIHNQSPGPVNMTDWQLMDQDGQVFVFPALILNEGGAIKVLSQKGNNTVIELYWQSEVPIWQPGEIAKLLTADGETIATYSIP
jgi:hypothetical protein